MKTAMQKLLNIINNDIINTEKLKLNGLNNISDMNTLLTVYNYIKIIIEKDMIEKEKEQIENAFDNGVYHSYYGSADSEVKFEGKDYYNIEFNQNK